MQAPIPTRPHPQTVSPDSCADFLSRYGYDMTQWPKCSKNQNANSGQASALMSDVVLKAMSGLAPADTSNMDPTEVIRQVYPASLLPLP